MLVNTDDSMILIGTIDIWTKNLCPHYNTNVLQSPPIAPHMGIRNELKGGTGVTDVDLDFTDELP